jgi:hypothetical protein
MDLPQRTLLMFGMLAAVAFLLAYVVNKVVHGDNSQQPVVGRFTKRFISYSIGALVLLAGSLMQLFGPNRANEFALGIVTLIFVLRFVYLAIQEYRRAGNVK